MQPTTICHIDKNNISLSATLFFDIFTNPPYSYTILQDHKTLEYFTYLYNNEKFSGYTYTLGDKCLGFCYGVIDDFFTTKTYKITEIFIHKDYQGMGHGNNFLNDISDDLKNKGFDNILLETSLQIKAYNFYIKNDFVVLDDIKKLTKFL